MSDYPEGYIDELLQRLPDPLRVALEGHAPSFQEEIALVYLAATPEDQAEIVAFVVSGGPEKICQERLKRDEGIPTCDDVRRMVEGDADGGES